MPACCRRRLDIGSQRLARLLAVGPVVDQYRHAVLRQPGDLFRSDLAAHQSPVVELADHRSIAPVPAFGGAGAGGGGGAGTAAGATGAGVAAPPFNP